MKNQAIKIKLSFITGLKPVVLSELASNSEFCILEENDDSVYVEFNEKSLHRSKSLRSVARAYVVVNDSKYHPSYLYNHKSILGDLVSIVTDENKGCFNSFKIYCAGSDSSEVRGIARYVEETYSIPESEDADLKIHIIKPEEIWEIGVQITPRPLSVRDYRVLNMPGAMDPTIAYAANSLCDLEKFESYLNIFSGSGTLLIEAGQCYPNLKKLIGFDNDKKHLSLSIQNIKQAGLIKKVEVKELNIFDKPDLGKFDVIASDLPFGMTIGKNENLNDLYKVFIEYSENVLKPSGRVLIYTSEHQIIEGIIKKSKFKVTKSLELKFMSSVNAYLRPKIIVCEL